MADSHGKPMNAVGRRREDGEWVLESGMNNAEVCDFEISLDDFISYWWEGLNDPSWTPIQDVIDGFVSDCTPQDYDNA